MSIITSGGGMDVTHGAGSPDDAALLAPAGGQRGVDAWEQHARDLLNQPATMTDKAKAAFATAEKALATSLLDPIVSDRDAKKVLDALEPLATREWLAVVRKLRETKAPEGTLFDRFAQRGLKDDNAAVERFLRQILDKLGTRDAHGSVSIPTDLISAIAREAGAPQRYELSSLGEAEKGVTDAAMLAAQLAYCLLGRR